MGWAVHQCKNFIGWDRSLWDGLFATVRQNFVKSRRLLCSRPFSALRQNCVKWVVIVFELEFYGVGLFVHHFDLEMLGWGC